MGSSRGLNFGSFSFLSGFVAGANGFPETRIERRYQVTETLGRQGERHSLKVGGDLMYLRSSTTQLSLSYGFYNFPGFGEFRDSQPSRYRQRVGEPQRKLINRILGVFVQDEWRIHPALNLSFGLRYDFETLLKGDANNWGPRLALAWDPFQAGNTAVRAGFGIFYNRVLLRTFEDFAVASGLAEMDLGTGPGSTGPIAALGRIGGFPHIFSNDVADPRVRDLVRSIQVTRSISSDLRIPYSLQSSLGLERQMGREVKLEVNYVLNRTVRLWRDGNINAPIPPPGGFVDFLLRPPAGMTGVIILADGSTAFDNTSRQIVDVGVGLVQFDLSDIRSKDVGSGNRRIRIFGLNSQPSSSSTTDPILAALNAVRYLRPNPALGELEQLQSDGQSTYHGLNLILSKRIGSSGFIRASYTLSKLIDNVVLNTSSPMDEFDVRLERSLGATDARHRFVLSGYVRAPWWLGRLEWAPVLQWSSGRPFTITSNGQDRNLNDTLTDRLHYMATGHPHWIRPGDDARSAAAAALFSFPTVGTNGSQGRNVAVGPGNRRLDARISRTITWGDHFRLRPSVDIYNLTNTTNFIMNGFYGPLDTRGEQSVFLQPRAARQPRHIELSLRVEF